MHFKGLLPPLALFLVIFFCFEMKSPVKGGGYVILLNKIKQRGYKQGSYENGKPIFLTFFTQNKK